MTVNKGLKSLVESNPNFSNNGLENQINQFKIGWVLKSFQLDSVIESNGVLTASQKNDLKDDINNVSHINLGLVLGDLLRHTATILDGSIIPGNPAITGTVDNGQGTFKEILQTVHNIQTLIPTLTGERASTQSRSVNDHLGTLNNLFVETEDSSDPVFTTLNQAISFINTADLTTETALETAYDNLKNFINGVVADSTDFQETLDNFATAVATAHTNLNNALASEPLLTHKTNLINMRESIVTQVNLEQANISGIRSFTETLSNNIGFASLGEDDDLRKLMTRVAQSTSWISYFNDYKENKANLNPIYTTNVDSDKSAIIDTVLRDKGLPDVLDFVDIEAVANKAKKDNRIDTTNYDNLTVEKQIADACKQLNIITANRSVYNQSELLLANLNKRDRDIIAGELDLNESSNTLS